MELNYYSYHVTRDGKVFRANGTEVRPVKKKNGYNIVCIYTTDSKKRTTKGVHRLIAEVYIPNPYHLSDVDHIDCDRDHNEVENLRWLSHGDNIKHSYDSGRRSAKGLNNARCLLTIEEVLDIKTLISKGYRETALSKFGYPSGACVGILCGKTWRDVN